MKILDCTLRDGGYYTNWDFDSKIVDVYIQAMNVLPIDYIELGTVVSPLRSMMESLVIHQFQFFVISKLLVLRRLL